MWLLDTHLVIWATYDAQRLPARAAKLIAQREAPLAFSHVSLWEVAIKASLGRPDFKVDPTELHGALIEEGFAELPISPAHIAQVATLPWLHRDPFDRMLAAQAQVEGLTLLSVDATLKRYGRFVRLM